MGTNLAPWNLLGLGLGEVAKLNILLQFIMQTEEDRLLIFRKYIEQILLRHEVIAPEHADSFQTISILFGLKDLGSVVYIDKSFTQQALRMLVNYGLLKDKIENSVHPSVFWSQDAIKNLRETNIASVRKAYQEHKTIEHEDTCTLCFEQYQGTWFKSGKWCNHTICSKCWLAYAASNNHQNDMICPVRDCGVIVPPSLYLALNTEVLENDNEYLDLQKAYDEQLLHHQTMRQEVLDGVPNLKTCTSCKINFIYNNKLPKPRKLICPACTAPHIITERAQGDLTPITTTGVWGYCNECKTLVDKPTGCSAIYCLVCKKGTIFVPVN